jgi:hypothetical protein
MADRVRAVLVDLLVVMERVRGEDHRSSTVVDDDDELAGGVPADLDELHAGREPGAVSGGEGQPAVRACPGQQFDLGGLGVQGELRAPGQR